MGGVPHTCTRMHTHAHTHIYTCLEIANGRRHGGIHVYHVYNMFNMHVCACVCVHVHACMHGTPPHTPIPIPTPIHPSATPQGGGPPESLKIR